MTSIYISKNIEKQRRKIYREKKENTYIDAVDFNLFIIQFFKKIHITFNINCNRSIINIIFSIETIIIINSRKQS